MSKSALTAKYRPQTFADVAGQATLKSILSRAALEDKVAPAYLFSGTRGVGKTTIARVFAKALNCRNAPTAEPCNTCDMCKAITLGTCVDVIEIDGASNRGIDDVRKLKEAVGYAPMDGRYKVFIIDEAHMLSREAFNALLKTLEEPPARVTFIMATTEAHKFPITIISRCQHYVYKRLSDAELLAHLQKILGLEGLEYEDAALRLLVRRAAGSVRDSMSLLGQVLALGGGKLTAADTRSVLGLAGQELFFDLFAALKATDCQNLSILVQNIMNQGLDLGFFLRELAGTWRNLFMLRQIGADAKKLLELPEAEAARWLEEAAGFSLPHIHACWQMTLEGQRRVLTSLEPALALELLLFNLAMMPRLLSMEKLSAISRNPAFSLQETPKLDDTAEKKSSLNENRLTESPEAAPERVENSVASQPQVEQEAAPSPHDKHASAASAPSPAEGGAVEFSAVPQGSGLSDAAMQNAAAPSVAPETTKEPAYVPASASLSATKTTAPNAKPAATTSKASAIAQNTESTENAELSAMADFYAAEAENFSEPADTLDTSVHGDLPRDLSDNLNERTNTPVKPKPVQRGTPSAEQSWESFIAFCQNQKDNSPALIATLSGMEGVWTNNHIELTAPDNFGAERIMRPEVTAEIKKLLLNYCGTTPTLHTSFIPKTETQKQDRSEILEKIQELPVIKALQTELEAQIIDYGPWYQ